MKPLVLAAWAVIVMLSPSAAHAQYVGPEAGQKVAFLGDSITANGWNHKNGYVHLVAIALEQQGHEITVIPAGISGHTSKDMLARLQRDVLAKHPDWMTLSCGVNDVWHGAAGVPLDQYESNIRSIVDQAQAAGIKVMILTSTLIMEDPGNEFNQKLATYNQFLRSLAQEKGTLLADLNADEQAELARLKAAGADTSKPLLTVDGVHPIYPGDVLMATGILKAFGSTDDQIAQAKTLWDVIPAPHGPLTKK